MIAQIALITAGIALNFTTIQINPARANTINTASIRLAQASNCPSSTYSHISAETSGYYVHICATQNGTPAFYVAQAKDGSGSITVHLDSYQSQKYVAINADTSYILTRKQLLVKQGNQTILTQSIYKWVEH